MLGAALLMHTLNKVTLTMQSGNADMVEKMALMAENLTTLQSAVYEQGHELDAIRSEFALHLTRRETREVDYELAIKAASSGKSCAEVQDTYGLREAEAQLLVTVYGGAAKDN